QLGNRPREIVFVVAGLETWPNVPDPGYGHEPGPHRLSIACSYDDRYAAYGLCFRPRRLAISTAQQPQAHTILDWPVVIRDCFKILSSRSAGAHGRASISAILIGRLLDMRFGLGEVFRLHGRQDLHSGVKGEEPGFRNSRNLGRVLHVEEDVT